MLRKLIVWGFPVLLFLLVGYAVAKNDPHAWLDFLGTVAMASVIFSGIVFWVAYATRDRN